MTESTIKKLNTEIKNELIEKLATKEMVDFMAKIKAAGSDSGTFEVVVSTGDLDRQGEIVDQSGWILDNYMQNPVVLFGHDYSSLPIGICDEIKVTDGKLIAKGRFAPADANPFAQQVRKMYDAGMLKTTSVGFIPLEFNNENTVLKAELLEFSFVAVPANPYALSLRQMRELGIDANMLVTKGITFSVTADKDIKEHAGGPAHGDDADADEADDDEAGGDEPNNAEALEHLRELLKSLHGNHVKNIDEFTTKMQKAIVGEPKKSIEEFTEKCFKAIEEFKGDMQGEHDRHSGEIMKAIDEYKKELPGDEEQNADDPKGMKKQKTGAEISKKNRTVLESVLEHIKAASGAVEGIIADKNGDDLGGDEGGDEKAQIKGRKFSGFENDKKAFEAFLSSKQVLKNVATVIGESLERLNKTNKEIRSK